MNLYRIIRTKHLKDDIHGIGASLFPGRWNKKDVRCIYAAESRALALIEHIANTTKDDYLHSSFTMRTLYIPDDLILSVSLKTLPKNWREKPAPAATKNFGTNLLQSKKALAYLLPSTIIPQEFNIIIDPIHPKITKMKIVADEPLDFDIRLKQ